MSSEPTPSIEPSLPSAPATAASSSEVNQLSSRLAVLETRFSPNSWLYGSSFFKRAFAMWGHVFVAGLIIGVVVWIVFFFCTAIFGLSLAGLSNR
jgi:hypothetical protein